MSNSEDTRRPGTPNHLPDAPSGSRSRTLPQVAASLHPGWLSTTLLPAPSANSPRMSPSQPSRGTIRASPNYNITPAAAAAADTVTVNIATLNVTYGGDHYGGAIHGGRVGGRRNRNESYSYTNAPSVLSFTVRGTTAACGVGMAGVFGVTGVVVALMLLRR